MEEKKERIQVWPKKYRTLRRKGRRENGPVVEDEGEEEEEEDLRAVRQLFQFVVVSTDHMTGDDGWKSSV